MVRKYAKQTEEGEIPDSTWKGSLVWAGVAHHSGGEPSPWLRSSGSYEWSECPERSGLVTMKWGKHVVNNSSASSRSIDFIRGLKRINNKIQIQLVRYFKHYFRMLKSTAGWWNEM